MAWANKGSPSCCAGASPEAGWLNGPPHRDPRKTTGRLPGTSLIRPAAFVNGWDGWEVLGVSKIRGFYYGNSGGNSRALIIRTTTNRTTNLQKLPGRDSRWMRGLLTFLAEWRLQGKSVLPFPNLPRGLHFTTHMCAYIYISI